MYCCSVGRRAPRFLFRPHLASGPFSFSILLMQFSLTFSPFFCRALFRDRAWRYAHLFRYCGVLDSVLHDRLAACTLNSLLYVLFIVNTSLLLFYLSSLSTFIVQLSNSSLFSFLSSLFPSHEACPPAGFFSDISTFSGLSTQSYPHYPQSYPHFQRNKAFLLQNCVEKRGDISFFPQKHSPLPHCFLCRRKKSSCRVDTLS